LTQPVGRIICSSSFISERQNDHGKKLSRLTAAATAYFKQEAAFFERNSFWPLLVLI